MIRFNFFLFLIFFSFVTCEKKEKKEAYEDPDLLYGLYRTFILPEQNRINSCKVPNSVNECGRTSDSCNCIANKVEQGLIFDVNTSQYITSEKLTTPTILSCLCPNKVTPDVFMWSKGRELNLESFPPNLPIDLIFLKAYQQPSVNLKTSDYPVGTNILCIAECNPYSYQIVKLRSNQ